jgi:hypothetical protein
MGVFLILKKKKLISIAEIPKLNFWISKVDCWDIKSRLLGYQKSIYVTIKKKANKQNLKILVLVTNCIKLKK